MNDYCKCMDQQQHRRNIILDQDLTERVSFWHGGQFTFTYSLCSCGLNDYVSVSMIKACISELESDLENWSTDTDFIDKIEELEELIDDLSAIIANPDEHTTLAHTGEDKDSGYATWLQE